MHIVRFASCALNTSVGIMRHGQSVIHLSSAVCRALRVPLQALCNVVGARLDMEPNLVACLVTTTLPMRIYTLKSPEKLWAGVFNFSLRASDGLA